MLEYVVPNRRSKQVIAVACSSCCMLCFKIAWADKCQEQVLRTGSQFRDARTAKRHRVCAVFGVAIRPSTRWLVLIARILVCFRFYLFRFLLICQTWKSQLNTSWNGFVIFELDSEHHFRTTFEIGCPGVFEPAAAITVFTKNLLLIG